MFHVKHEVPPADVAAMDPGTQGQLRRYKALLRDRAIPLGLIGAADRDRLWDRHILDSLRGVAAVRPEDADAYDLGSGAGLPGIPVAIACPDLLMRVVDSRRNRAAFLELVVEELGLENVRVVAGRVEDLAEPVDLCFARAFADARSAWDAAAPRLRTGGRLVYFAGESFEDAFDLPPGVVRSNPLSSALARAGTLVIMTRQ
jgi:16S rRNA (guanine527-N7)-methyltransferase